MSAKVYYHYPCADGMAAMVILKRALAPLEFQCIPYEHGKTEIQEAKKGDLIYFVDCCPDAAILTLLKQEDVRIVVMDHHPGARVNTKEAGVALMSSGNPGHSAAGICWRRLIPTSSFPLALKYIEDYDTGHFTCENRAFTAAVGLKEEVYTKLLFHDADEKELARIMKEGAQILFKRDAEIIPLMAKVDLQKFGVFQIAYIPLNDPFLANDASAAAAAYLKESADIIVCYTYNKEGDMTRFSLRRGLTSTTDLNVFAHSLIASCGALSGGGHAAAAGVQFRGRIERFTYVH